MEKHMISSTQLDKSTWKIQKTNMIQTQMHVWLMKTSQSIHSCRTETLYNGQRPFATWFGSVCTLGTRDMGEVPQGA